jgi:mono/diheme cytochrome c family protein
LLAALALGCDPPGKPKPADRPVPADQVKDFGTLYATHCAGCHGANGKFGPAPPLNDPLFLAIVPDEELLHVIAEGRAVSPTQKSLMPAFRLGKGAPLTEAQAKVWDELKEETRAHPRQQAPLTAAQVKVLADGIKARWGGASPKERPPPYAAPKVAGDKGRGAKLFDLACATCHGDEGRGGERAGAVNNRAFLALVSDQALRRIIITGRRDLGMPDYSNSEWRSPKFEPLTSEQINDLVALLAYWRLGGQANGK